MSVIEVVGLVHDEGHEHAGSRRNDGDEEQAEAGDALHPELQIGHLGQVDAQEVEVDGEDLLGGGSHSGLDRGQVIRGDEGGQIQLVIAVVGKIAHHSEGAGLHRLLGGLQRFLDGVGGGPAHAGGHRAPVPRVGDLGDLVGVQPHHVLQRLADDGVQGQQNEQGEHGPQAAPHGIDVLLGVELLDLLVIPGLVLAVLLLEFLHFPREHVHLDHAPLSLQGQGEQNELHHQGEEDEGHTVAVEEVVEEHQQPGEGRHDVIGEIHGHGLHFLWLR